MDDSKASKLLQMGAMTFGNFAAVFTNAPFLRNSGSVDCILRMMKRHSQDTRILIQCYRAIGNIALISEDMRLYLIDNGCEDAVNRCRNDDPDAEKEKGECLRYLLTPHVKKHKMMAEVDISDFKKRSRLTKDVRNFLIQGSVVKIVKKDGEKLEFHLFMTPDLKEIICKKPKNPTIKQKWRLPLHQVKGVTAGIKKGDNFEIKKGLFWKRPNEKECFSIKGPLSLDGQRNFHVIARNASQADEWVNCLEIVLEDYI